MALPLASAVVVTSSPGSTLAIEENLAKRARLGKRAEGPDCASGGPDLPPA
jgi:hypothetical protein